MSDKNKTPKEYKEILKKNGFVYNPGYKCWTSEKLGFSIGCPILESDIKRFIN